ncbi:LacI family DNA-binding transcriptional regulator [Bacillus rugosus]|uniref:LacI family DNA-binding transcriptional regulator n=1 Tax=Bacillus rugosus TaxID=2715209 RepID=UPI0035A3B1EB
MSITTKDIARIANVSQSTVSRCLNDSSEISERTKKRILKIANELGYQINTNARSLSARKTYTIGVVLPQFIFKHHLDTHFRSWQAEIIESLERMELDVVVSFSENRFTNQDNIKRLILTSKVDGLIILEPNLNEDTINFLETTNTPFIFCKYIPSFYENREVDSVSVNQFEGGYLAGQHLINLGHQNIMCISANYEGNEFKLRREGFNASFYDNGLQYNDDFLFMGDCSFKSGYNIVKENQKALKKITAIFAQNDLMALGAIEALKELNINVPADIAVIGFDDIELCTFYKPYLTTVHQPIKEIATLTCKRLIEKLNFPKATLKQQIKISPSLVTRDSCGISS